MNEHVTDLLPMPETTRGRKLGVYAAYGIPEVWVIDAESLVTHVYKSLGAEGYRSAHDVAPDAPVSAGRAGGVGFSFARLGLSLI